MKTTLGNMKYLTVIITIIKLLFSNARTLTNNYITYYCFYKIKFVLIAKGRKKIYFV